MGLGVLSKMCIIPETVFGVYNGAATKKRVELSNDSVTPDFGYKDPDTITGVRIKADNIQTRKSVEGSVSIVAGPENGFPNFLKYLCGTVTTYTGGEFFRERFTNSTSVTVQLTNFAVLAASYKVYKKVVGGNWTQLTEDYGATPSATEFSINITTGEITLGAALSLTDQIMVEYCKAVANVYSHVITAADQGSFQYWNWKGQIELFEYTGVKINTGTLNINAEDFLMMDCDFITQNETTGTTTGHVFPTAEQLSSLDPFIFKQAKAWLDWTEETMLENVTIEINNNLDPRFSIRGDNTCRAITPGKQEVSISTELEFTDMTYYNKFRNATRGVLEIKYGTVNGVQIGSTGVYYQFQMFVPNFRFETGELPTETGTLMISADGFANVDKGLDYGYQFVIINGEASI